MDLILTPSDFEDLNALEYAAIRRQVISIEFKAEPDAWKSFFLKKVENEKEGIVVITTNEEKISLDHINRISPSFEQIELDVIGCLCH